MRCFPVFACSFLAFAPNSAWAQQSSPAPAEEGKSSTLVFKPEFFAGASLDTALQMLQRLPGFTLDFGNSDARGLAGNSGNVLVNGRPPSSKSDSLAEILRRIPSASVERIELIRGGAPGIDMQGQPVVANVVLRREESTSKVIEAEAYVYTDGYVGPLIKGQYSHRLGDSAEELAFEATTDRTNGTAWGSRTRTDAAGNTIEQADLDLWDRYRNANLRGSIQRPAGGGLLRLNALADYTNLNTSQSLDILPAVGTDSYAEDVTHRWKGELGANWTRALGPRTELQIVALQRASREHYDSSFDSGGASTFGAKTVTGESIFRPVLRHRQNDRWAFEGGGELAYNFLDSTTAYTEMDALVALPNDQVFVDELRGEGFAQATWQPSKRLTVEGGLRVELSRIAQRGDRILAKTFVYPKPRLQISWRPAAGHQFRIRAEKTVSQLDFGDFVASSEINLGTVVGGNADLQPQLTLTLLASYERRFWTKGAFELTAQHQEIDDVIDIIPLAGGFDAVGNIGRGTFDRLEAQLTLPLDRLGIANARFNGRAAVQRSRVTDPLTGERRRLSREVPVTCSVGFSHDLSGGRFTYGFAHDCNVDRSDIYRVRELRTTVLEPYLTIYGQWKPRADLTVRVDLGNTTNAPAVYLREVHSGPRNTSPLLYRERRSQRRGQNLLLQVRKTL